MRTLKRPIHRTRRLINQFLGRDVWSRSQTQCSKEALGSDYGGYTICPRRLGPESIVYSVGIGEDLSFDEELYRRYGSQIFLFDPTPRAFAWLQRQSFFEDVCAFPFGLADHDGWADFEPPHNPNHVSHRIATASVPNASRFPVYRLTSIMQLLQHTAIDILKLDIEGAEYAVIEDVLNERVTIGQILVEFHHLQDQAQLPQLKRILKLLHDANFSIFDISPLGAVYSFLWTGDGH